MTLRQRALFFAPLLLVVSFIQFSAAGTLLPGSSSGEAPANASVATTAADGMPLQASQTPSGNSTDFDSSIISNWPMFKNQATRLSSNPLERTINADNAKFLTLSWVGLLGDLVDFSSPAIMNGVVYLTSLDGNLYTFNANGCGLSSCNPLWIGTMSSEFSSVSSPAVANGMVYVGSADHKMYVFAAGGCGHNTCTPLWTGNTAGPVFSSPVVSGNVVYVGSEDHKLYAFAAGGCGRSSCVPLWTGNTGGKIDSSPAVANGLVYVGSQDGKLYAFSAAGCHSLFCKPVWTAQAGDTIFGSSPAVSNGQVYIASFSEPNSSDSKLYSFNANGCGAPTCQPLWSAPAGDFVTSSPAVANGRVYIGSGDDLMYVFDANGCHMPTCNFLWRGEAVGAQAALVSSPAVANGVVYVGEMNGMVEVFDANGCGDSICLPLTQLRTNNEQIVSSSPAVVNGSVYFGSADQFSPPIGRLYVFKLSR